MQTITEALSNVRLGEPARFRNLTVFPLFAPNGLAPDYLTLDEALEQRLARVTEVSEGGSVPELAFENDAGCRVLLVDAPATFRKFMARLVESYAMDAIEAGADREAEVAARQVKHFIADMEAAVAERFPPVGEGEDVRLSGKYLAGGALVADGRVVHLAAFRIASEEAGEPGQSRARLRSRRRRRAE